MFEIVFDPSQPLDKREKGADNLVYLARERAGAETLFKEGCIQKIVTYMKIEKNPNIRLSLIRLVAVNLFFAVAKKKYFYCEVQGWFMMVIFF